MAKSESPVETPKHDLKKRAVRGSMIVLGAQGFHVALHIISVVTLARLLEPEDFGIVAMVAPVQALAILIKTIGLGDAIVQRQDLKPDQLNALFWIQLAVCTALALGMAMTAPAVAWFYDRDVLSAITVAYSSVILMGGLSSVHENLLTRRLAFGKVAFTRVTASVLGFVTGIVAALILKTYWALVLMVIAKAMIEVMLFWILAQWLPGLPRRTEGVGNLVLFGSSVAGARIAHFVSNNGITVLLGKVLGEAALGLYDRSNRLLLYPTSQLHKPLQGIGIPLLSRLQDTPDRYRKAFTTMLQGLAITASPGLVTVIIYAEEVALLAFGEGWGDVVPLFAMLAPVALLQLINHPLAWLYFTQGRPGEMVGWAWTRASILFSAVVIGLPFGLIGVVACYAGAQLLIVTPIIWIWSTRTGPVSLKDAFSAILPYLAGVLPTLLLLEFTRQRLELPAIAEFPLAVIIAYVAMGAVALAFPTGRAGLRDLAELRYQLKRSSRPTNSDSPAHAVSAKGA